MAIVRRIQTAHLQHVLEVILHVFYDYVHHLNILSRLSSSHVQTQCTMSSIKGSTFSNSKRMLLLLLVYLVARLLLLLLLLL